MSDEKTLALRQLCRYRAYLVDQIGELKVKAITILDQIFPEYSKLFTDIFGVSSKALLQQYSTPEELLSISTSDLSTFLTKASRGSLGYAKAELIHATAKTTFGIKYAVDAFSFQLKQILAEIEFIETHVKDTEAQMSSYFAEIDSHLTSIPGIGMVLAASIESEIGDISRFDDPSKLVAFIGIDPSIKQSGQFNSNRNRMSKRGSPYLRRSV